MKTPTKVSESGVRGDGAASAPYIIAQGKNLIADEYHHFLADIEDLIKASTSLTGEDLVQAKAALNARINEAKKSFEEMGGAIADKARSSAKATNNYVHENPWQAIGIGAALGLVIGVVVARRQ